MMVLHLILQYLTCFEITFHVQHQVPTSKFTFTKQYQGAIYQSFFYLQKDKLLFYTCSVQSVWTVYNITRVQRDEFPAPPKYPQRIV